ncbi:MAG TPA: hypothetical protein VGG29_03360 [Caulobacteraceae bacterium]|jgi:hypothetical protein
MPRLAPHPAIVVSGALLAAMLGAGAGADCRLAPQAAEAATPGPHMQMSEAAVLTPSPLPVHWPAAPAGGSHADF